MKKLLLFAAASFYLLTSCAHETPRQVAFVSKKATEATLTFSWFVEMDSDKKPTLVEAKEQAGEQVQHMFGPMERADRMAAPKEDHVITVKASDIQKIAEGRWRIAYDYEGTLVLQNGPRSKYKFPLPVDPDKIFQAAMSGSQNHCTDEHYQSEGDFWYFWAPKGWGKDEYPKCPLRSNENGQIDDGEDYEIVTGEIDRIKKVRTTYPEYDRMAVKDIVDVHFFYGMDEPTGTADPYKSRDINAESYRNVVRDLKEMGFEVRKWSKAELDSVYPPAERDGKVFVEEAVKQYAGADGKKTVRARIFFGQTGIDEKSLGFHHFFCDALKNAAVMVYNGHSGLGGHLDLDAIADNVPGCGPGKKRYQVYFFNSCTSYTYYNSTYLNRKRVTKGKKHKIDPSGTKNLDIMANGLSTAFDVMHDTDMSLVRAIDKYASKGKWTSWQSLAREIDSDNLFTVNGDEDNPTKPR